jgi:hypothetical protein
MFILPHANTILSVFYSKFYFIDRIIDNLTKKMLLELFWEILI